MTQRNCRRVLMNFQFLFGVVPKILRREGHKWVGIFFLTRALGKPVL